MITHHVLPIDDEEEHDMALECPCKPVVRQYPTLLVVVHNAFDCREYVEQAERMPGIQPTEYAEPRWGIWKSE